MIVGCEKLSCVITHSKVEFWLNDRVITAGDVVGNKVEQEPLVLPPVDAAHQGREFVQTICRDAERNPGTRQSSPARRRTTLPFL